MSSIGLGERADIGIILPRETSLAPDRNNPARLDLLMETWRLGLSDAGISFVVLSALDGLGGQNSDRDAGMRKVRTVLVPLTELNEPYDHPLDIDPETATDIESAALYRKKIFLPVDPFAEESPVRFLGATLRGILKERTSPYRHVLDATDPVADIRRSIGHGQPN